MLTVADDALLRRNELAAIEVSHIVPGPPFGDDAGASLQGRPRGRDGPRRTRQHRVRARVDRAKHLAKLKISLTKAGQATQVKEVSQIEAAYESGSGVS